MKNSLLLVIAIAIISSSVYAQIPNSSFEMWDNMGAYENPQDWATLNDYTTGASVYTATKGTPGSPGSSYLKLTSKTVGPAVVNGIAVSGIIDPVTQLPISGFAFNQQPANFSGKWQHMIFGTSQGSLNVELTRWDSGTNSRVVVATASQVLSGMAMSWANFTIPFVYTDTQAPDSCIIVLKASGSNPTDQDYLWVDNMAFTGNLSVSENSSLITSLDIFPNPATENFNVKLESKESNSIVFELVSVSGTIILSRNENVTEGMNEFNISTNGIAKGSYLLRIVSGLKSETRSVVIK